MKRSLAYITAAWRGDPAADMEQAAHYCRVVYDAGYSPICPMLYLPLFQNDIAVAQRLGITATTLEGILTVKGQGRR